MDKNELIEEITRNFEIKQGIAVEKKNKEIKKVYSQFPELERIDRDINELGLNSMRIILKNPQKASELKKDFERKLYDLNDKREKFIFSNKINPNYNKPVYDCKKCNDTGYLEDGSRCECFEKELTKFYFEKSKMGNMLKNSEFKNFSLDYYSDKKTGDKQSPREIMEEALKCSKYFVKNFDNVDYNLFFYGDTGLGKTFLSSVIAANLMRKGKSVSYVRANKMFSIYDDYKFNDYSLKSEVDEFEECDLLVIDDLGSEYQSKTGIAFLGELINDRICANKKTIINTNLDIGQFSKIYTIRLTSRIYENYKIFKFEGEDIRIKKLLKNNKKDKRL
ncbi:MAG: ATP-binding protein [Clostridia bacterium]|nr:ATP-binding protein [Clostridia bacterium]